jgi:hypothetical protein
MSRKQKLLRLERQDCDLGNAQMCSDVAAASTAVSLRPSHDTLLMSMVSVRRYTPVNSLRPCRDSLSDAEENRAKSY